MSAHAERQASRYAVGESRPATFLERGVSVPFTTPFLLGGRVRPGKRAGLEVVVPSPAGVRGSYVLPFSALPEVCTPTLHDRLLSRAIQGATAITPDAILRIARGVAKEGLAGREAAAAAGAADRAEESQSLVTNYRLLLHLVEQSEPPCEQTMPAARDMPANVERRGRRAIARTAATLNLQPEVVIAALDALAEIFSGIGFRGDPTRARYQRQLAELEVMTAEIAAWCATAIDAEDMKAASMVHRCAGLTLGCGRPLMQQLTELPDAMRGLMNRWTHEPAGLLDLAARPGWLLDGWATLTGIWRSAAPCERSAAIREMSLLVPVMPQEADHWLEAGDERFEVAYQTRRRFVLRLEEWRTGRPLDLIARNEKLVREVV